MPAETILEVKNISKSFKDGHSTIEVLKDITFSIQKGEFVAILGPSGSGKSTLLSIIGALLTPSQGHVNIENDTITNYNSKQLTKVRAQRIGFIFQSANLIPYLTVQDQLLLIQNMAKGKRRSSDKKSLELLENLGLSHHRNSYPRSLSGGEKQRVAIARALMNDANLILADEPTASLDSEKGRNVVEMIACEVRNRQKAAIMVTHDHRMIDLCDRVFYMQDGTLVENSK
ncbi:ABC transporter ATP-binding protein [Rummeliibacillus suwonensis]|uniref:ABC transporter ATP-binding protein n=1 Tax=Rummeliibacillus suwonensis TaxID=1306154 RepID=UPI0011B84805|nr:ABC transporter ATP-binding protein [Rummeliibacillus suwonensis]